MAMDKCLVWIALFFLAASTGRAGVLSEADAQKLQADVAGITADFERGDAEALIRKTHPALYEMAGGEGAYARIVRQGVDQLRQSGVKFTSSDVRKPTQTHMAGDEEVCFVPRVSIMEISGRKMKSTTFMIAVRRIGGEEWRYLDGAGLRKHPEMLYQLFPELERNITLPANKVEAIES